MSALDGKVFVADEWHKPEDSKLKGYGRTCILDGGNIYTSNLPKFSDFRFGTGLGLRYYSSFGPIRVDVGTPLNRRPGESLIGVYVSLGQAF